MADTAAADRRRIAVHEAAHAVVAVQLGLSVRYVTIRSTEWWTHRGVNGCLETEYLSSLGHAMVTWPGIDVDLEPWCLMLLAASAAERRQFGESKFDSDDMRQARHIVGLDLFDLTHCRKPTEQQIDVGMRPYYAKSARLVFEHWEWIRRVAKELDRMTGLLSDEIRALKQAA